MEIVVNEWFIEYLRPNSEQYQHDLIRNFINVLVRKHDKIVIRRPSPFVDKFYHLMKACEWDTNSKKRFKKINELLFRDSDSTIIIDNNDVKPLPDTIKQKVPNDDMYLIELAFTSNDKIFVTTDGRLKDKLKDEPSLKIYLLKDFISDYLRSSGNAICDL